MVDRRPPAQFKYAPELALRATWMWRMSDYQTVPSPGDVADIDLDWLQDLNTMNEWIQFHEDKLKASGTP